MAFDSNPIQHSQLCPHWHPDDSDADADDSDSDVDSDADVDGDVDDSDADADDSDSVVDSDAADDGDVDDSDADTDADSDDQPLIGFGWYPSKACWNFFFCRLFLLWSDEQLSFYDGDETDHAWIHLPPSEGHGISEVLSQVVRTHLLQGLKEKEGKAKKD